MEIFINGHIRGEMIIPPMMTAVLFSNSPRVDTMLETTSKMMKLNEKCVLVWMVSRINSSSMSLISFT